MTVGAVALLGWRARAIYQHDTLPFLERLAATTAMTEVIANEWLDARAAETRLLAALLENVTAGTDAASPAAAPSGEILHEAERALSRISGLSGAWIATDDGRLGPGTGAAPSLRPRLRRSVEGARDSLSIWSEPGPGPAGISVVLVQPLDRSPQATGRAALVLLYDPSRTLLARVLDVPVPARSAQNRIYVARGDSLVEMMPVADAHATRIPIDSAPASIRRALRGEESVGPDVTIEGEAAHVATRRLDRLDWLLVRTADRGEALNVAFWPRFILEAVGLLVLLTVILAGLAAHRRAVARAELEAALARSELQALQLQLQPHFLLNALAGVAALVRGSPDRAAELLHRIAGFLRTTLHTVGVQQVSLRRELELLAEYLAIEEFRLGPSLRVEIDVPADVRAAVVPTLMLQPLAENVIRHAYLGPEAVTTLAISAERRDGLLVVRLRDDGRGLTRATPRIGLGNTRSRLQQLYGSAASLAVNGRPDGGTVVELRVPFEQVGDADVE